MGIQSSGDIEIFCHPAGSGTRGSVPFFDKIEVGDRLSLLFVPDGSGTPPYSLKIRSTTGAMVPWSGWMEIPRPGSSGGSR